MHNQHAVSMIQPCLLIRMLNATPISVPTRMVLQDSASKDCGLTFVALQIDEHIAELTVRETFDFAARCQGTALRQSKSFSSQDIS